MATKKHYVTALFSEDPTTQDDHVSAFLESRGLNSTSDSYDDGDNLLEDTLQALTIGTVSAATSFINSGVAIGNFAGGDFEETRTQDWIPDSYEDDYLRSQGAYDLTGTIVSSLVPGTLGLRAARGIARGNKTLSRFYDTRATRKSHLAKVASAVKAFETRGSFDKTKFMREILAPSAVVGFAEGATFELAAYAGTQLFKDLQQDDLDAMDVLERAGTAALWGGGLNSVFYGLGNTVAYNTRLNAKLGKLPNGVESSAQLKVADEGSRIVHAKHNIEVIKRDTKAGDFAIAEQTKTQMVNIDESLRAITGATKGDTALFNQLSLVVKNGSYELTRKLLSGHKQITAVPKASRGAKSKVAKRKLKTLPNHVKNKLEELKTTNVSPLQALLDLQVSAPEELGSYVAKWVGANKNELHKYLDSESYVNLETGARYAELPEPFLADFGISSVSVPSGGITRGKVTLSNGEVFKYGKSPEVDRVIAQKALKVIETSDKIANKVFPKKPKKLEDNLALYEALHFAIEAKKIAKKDAVFPIGISSKTELADALIAAKKDKLKELMGEEVGADKVLQELGTDSAIAADTKEAWLTLATQAPLHKAVNFRAISSPVKFTLEAKKAFLWDRYSYGQTVDFVEHLAEQSLGRSKYQLPALGEGLLKGAINAGASLVTSAANKGKHFGVEQSMVAIGKIKHGVTLSAYKAHKDKLADVYGAMGNDQKSVIEFTALRNWYDGLNWKPKLLDTDQGVLVGRDTVLRAYEEFGAIPEQFVKGKDYFLTERTASGRWLKTWHKEHVPLAAEKLRLLRAEGLHPNFAPDDFYLPPRPIKFGAFVYNKEGLGANRKVGLIRAQSAEELQEAIQRASQDPNLVIRSISDTQEYYDAVGRFDISKSFSTKYENELLPKAGKAADFSPNFDPDTLIYELDHYVYGTVSKNKQRAVRLMYSREFSVLEDLHTRQKNIASSGKQDKLNRFDVRNTPASTAIKTMLDIAPEQSIEFLSAASDTIERIGSRYVNTLRAKYADYTGKRSSKLLGANPEDTLEFANKVYSALGNKEFETASELILSSHPDLDKRQLQKFLSQANGWQAMAMLRADGLDGLVNNMSVVVLGSTEFKAILKDLPPEARKTMVEYYTLKGGAVKEWSPINSVLGGTKGFLDRRTGGEYETKVAKWKERLVWDDADEAFEQIGSIVANTHDGGLKGLKRANGLLAKLGKKAKPLVFGISDKLNDHAQYQVLHMVDEIGEIAGLTEGQMTSLAVTLKGRLLGHNIPSQKPTLFHGVLGTPVSLYQNYNLNVLNLMFRNAGRKGQLQRFAAMQAGMFGLQGLPGFEQLNEAVHDIYGKQSGADIKSIVDGIGGLETTKWLMYGSGSVAVDGALYSRGDLNQRNRFVLPTALEEIPVIRAVQQIYGSFTQATSDVANGVSIGTASADALAHTQLNRPLTGIIDTLRGYSTSSKGGLAQRTLSEGTSWRGNLSRILGARPFEEALIRERQWRLGQYQAEGQKEITVLGRSLNRMLLSRKGDLDGKEFETFRRKYLQQGRTEAQFEKWYKDKLGSWNEDAVQRLEKRVRGTRLENTFMQYFE